MTSCSSSSLVEGAVYELQRKGKELGKLLKQVWQMLGNGGTTREASF